MNRSLKDKDQLIYESFDEETRIHMKCEAEAKLRLWRYEEDLF